MQTLRPRDRLHALIDALPDGDVTAVERLLEALSAADPALRAALLAPIDYEPLAESAVARIEQASREIASGDYLADDDLDAIFSTHSR